MLAARPTTAYRTWIRNVAPYNLEPQQSTPTILRRQLAAGDQLRVIYDNLSKDPNSLANLDQDLPNYAQHQVPRQKCRSCGHLPHAPPRALQGLCRLLSSSARRLSQGSEAHKHMTALASASHRQPTPTRYLTAAVPNAGQDLQPAAGVALVRDVVRQHDQAPRQDHRPVQQPAHQGGSLRLSCPITRRKRSCRRGLRVGVERQFRRFPTAAAEVFL